MHLDSLDNTGLILYFSNGVDDCFESNATCRFNEKDVETKMSCGKSEILLSG
jgi:hypothetical protein